jgi:hypothetical protein
MPGRHIEKVSVSGWSLGLEPLGEPVDRRDWLHLAAGVAAWLSGFVCRLDSGAVADDAKTSRVDQAADEIQRAETRARKVTSRPLLTARSPHYQAIGDASESFIKLTLSDCERIALDYLHHYRAKGFDVKLPDRRLTMIVFRDERPFQRFADNVPPGTTGFYSRPSNWLALYDFRNVPMNPRGPGQTNMETLSHEATHQLTFNTGLLDRKADIPLCILEGLAMYGERRRFTGPSEPGQINLRRLEELAHLQRRLNWIPVADLLADDRAWYGTDEDHRTLGYAESWLLVHHLMTNRARLPQFRDYLKAIQGRRDSTHRREDAQAHFGDLARLDRELRQAAIRLQQAP